MTEAIYTRSHRRAGMFAAWSASGLLTLYAVTLIAGLLALDSPDDPIGNPYFTVLELLIVAMMPFLILAMVALHAFAAPEKKGHALFALIMMILATAITSGVHFVILTVSRDPRIGALAWNPLFFSFTWPSVVYALDILAWDWFFALSMISGVPVLKPGGLEGLVRWLMAASGILSLAGLVGVPLADMQVRLIGVLGYAGLTPLLFLLLGFVFKRSGTPGTS